MSGINFKLIGAIVIAGAVSMFFYDLVAGNYKKEKFLAANWVQE